MKKKIGKIKPKKKAVTKAKGLVKVEPSNEQLAAKKAKEATSLQKVAQSLVVKDQPSYEKGATFINELKAKYDEVEDTRLGITRAIDAAKKKVMALFAPPKQQLTDAISIVDGKLIEYSHAEQEKARKVVARKAARAAKKAKDPSVAKDIKEAAAEEAAPQASGISEQTYWRAEVVDITELVKAVAAGSIELDAITAHMPHLNKLARHHQDESKAPPGVEFVKVVKTIRTGGNVGGW